METLRRSTPSCPVCKAIISKSKLIPIYGRGSSSPKDPRQTIPDRPKAKRPPTAPNPPGDQFRDDSVDDVFGGGFSPMPTFQVGGLSVSTFPGMFGMHFHTGGHRRGVHHRHRVRQRELTPEEREAHAAQEAKSRKIIFVIMVLVVILQLLM